MFRLLFNMTPQQLSSVQQRNKKWTCCFGMHVITATVMIGVWHLFLNILALSMLAVIWRNPHMMEELQNTYDYNVDMDAPALPTPLSKVEPPYAYHDHSISYRTRPNYDTGGLVCTCMIAITLMMIYGTVRGKPGHLMPFLCLQLFDFAITTLTGAGYLCYLQTTHNLVARNFDLPWREMLLQLSPEQLVVVVLVVFVCIVFFKAYAIAIVWRCYKYLTLYQQTVRPFLPCVITDLQPVNEERPYSTLLPNYDEAVSQFMKQAPPPSYHVAMANYNMNESGSPAAAAGTNSPAASPTSLDAGLVAPSVAFHHPLAIDMESLDNNNDLSNNNNTVHINNNSPVARRAEEGEENHREGDNANGNAIGGEGEAAENDVVIEDDVASTSSSLPPNYDDAMIMAAQQAAAKAAAGAVGPPASNVEEGGASMTIARQNMDNESQA